MTLVKISNIFHVAKRARRAVLMAVPFLLRLPVPFGKRLYKKAGALFVYPIQGTAKHPTRNKQSPRANRLYTSRVYMASKERRNCLSFVFEIGRF